MSASNPLFQTKMDEDKITTIKKEEVSKDVDARFTVENNSFVSKEETEAKPVQVEIGDTKQEDFLPQIKLKKWDNEANFSARFITDQPTLEVVTEEGKVKMMQEKQEIHFYEKKINFHDEYAVHVTPPFEGKFSVQTEPFEALKIGENIIGRDTEEERDIRQADARKMRGDVLIVGLGLGVMNQMVRMKDGVTSVTVVEINQEVIDYVASAHPDRLEGITVICDDFYNFVQNTPLRFDSIYGDIFPALRYGDILKWKDFADAAAPILKIDGVLDGRAAPAYAHIMDTPPEANGLEFEVILNEKPDTNVFEFSIQTKDVDFFYQGELTEEEIAAGCFRPASVIGSYAVYFSDRGRGGSKYTTGKVGHIFRPKIIDANGEWVWGELSVDVERGILSITAPQDFLDKKAYPMIVDPTIGYQVQGASTETSSQNLIVVLKTAVTTGASDDGMVGNKMGVFLNTSGGGSNAKSKTMIYNTDLTPLTDGMSEERYITGIKDQLRWWFRNDGRAVLAASTAYYLCMWAANSKLNHQIAYDTTVLGDGATQSLTYTSNGQPNPLVPVDNTHKYSIWLEYSDAYATIRPKNTLKPKPFRPGFAR